MHRQYRNCTYALDRKSEASEENYSEQINWPYERRRVTNGHQQPASAEHSSIVKLG